MTDDISILAHRRDRLLAYISELEAERAAWKRQHAGTEAVCEDLRRQLRDAKGEIAYLRECLAEEDK